MPPPLSGTDDYIKRDAESEDVQNRAMLREAPTQCSLYAVNELNKAIGKEVTDSKTGDARPLFRLQKFLILHIPFILLLLFF